MVSNLFLKFKNILFVKNSTRCYGSNDHFALFGTAQKTDRPSMQRKWHRYKGRLVVAHICSQMNSQIIKYVSKSNALDFQSVADRNGNFARLGNDDTKGGNF